jgi:hypothetical protein
VAGIDVAGLMSIGLIDAGEPPLLVVHGLKDLWVPTASGIEIIERAASVGTETEARLLESVNHTIWRTSKQDIFVWMADFLFENVIRPGEPLRPGS